MIGVSDSQDRRYVNRIYVPLYNKSGQKKQNQHRDKCGQDEYRRYQRIIEEKDSSQSEGDQQKPIRREAAVLEAALTALDYPLATKKGLFTLRGLVAVTRK